MGKAEDDGAVPLYMACQRGRLEVVWLLAMERDGDMDEGNDVGEMLLYAVCQVRGGGTWRVCGMDKAKATHSGTVAGPRSWIAWRPGSRAAVGGEANNSGCTPILVARAG